MSSFNFAYPAIDLGLEAKDNETYLNQLSSFLAGNSTAFGGSLSSPELTSSSNGSSPESSAGGPAPGPGSVQSTAGPTKPAPTKTGSIGASGTDKRKQNDNNVTTAHKDRRESVGAPHTHDGQADEDDDEAGEGKGKTSERRRQQNRQAQRAFRERKEKHLKELEDRVFSLEQQSQDQTNENSALKQLLERLQSENERLKVFETAFSFTYADAKNMPASEQFKPPTPPTAQDEVDDLANFNGSFSFGSSPADNLASSSAGPSPSLFGSLGNSPSSFGLANPSPPAQVAGQTPGAMDSFLKSFTAPSPASTTGDSTTSGNASVATPPDDLFSAYRDPSASFGVPSLTSLNDLDTLFGGAAGTSSLDNDVTDFSAFLTSPLPSQSTPSGSLASVAGVSPGASAACPLGLDKATFLAKKGKEPFTFDLDNLCSDLKAKAVCQEAARQALQEAMKEDANSLESLFPTPTSS